VTQAEDATRILPCEAGGPKDGRDPWLAPYGPRSGGGGGLGTAHDGDAARTPHQPTRSFHSPFTIHCCRFFPSLTTPSTLRWQLAGGNGTYDRTDQASVVLACARERWRAVPASDRDWSYPDWMAGYRGRSNTGGAWLRVIFIQIRRKAMRRLPRSGSFSLRGNAKPCASTRTGQFDARPSTDELQGMISMFL
jgi:hypothetical protein